MTEGTILIGKNNNDMVEFMRYIRANGGECVCTDYDLKRIEVIRGTYEEKSDRFTMDGILGVVDPGDANSGEAEQTGRRELLQGDERNILQSGYVEDIRTG